jgi:hypothetical protein
MNMLMERVSDKTERERKEAANAKKRRRYVLVRYDPKHEYYTLVQRNQGRFHYDDAATALAAAVVLRPSLESKMGWTNIKVLSAMCWESGDCCGTVFSEEDVKENELRVEGELSHVVHQG